MIGVVENWALVEIDFQEFYGIDLEQTLPDKSYRWFLVRSAGLLSIQSRLRRALKITAEPEREEPDE